MNPFYFPNMQPIRLVTFDVTGTLLFFCPPIVQKYLETGEKFGIKADSAILGKNFKEAWKTLNKEFPNHGKNKGLNWQDWWALVVEKTFSGYIKPNEKHKISGILQDLMAFYSTREAFIKRPGTEDLLIYLKSKPILLGVISNYDPRLEKILEFMELRKYFDFILNSYEFGFAKPDVKIFEEAMRLGKCASGREAIHVGDDLELDYLGAKKAGLRSILITSEEKILENSKVNKNEVFKDFFKLKDYFEELNKTHG